MAPLFRALGRTYSLDVFHVAEGGRLDLVHERIQLPPELAERVLLQQEVDVASVDGFAQHALDQRLCLQQTRRRVGGDEGFSGRQALAAYLVKELPLRRV